MVQGLAAPITAKSVLVCFCTCAAIILTAWALPARAAQQAVPKPSRLSSKTHSETDHSSHKGLCEQILLPLDTRGKLATYLESEKARVGLEIGVQTGNFAETILRQWKHNTKYYLVDVWAPLTNYVDSANVGEPLHGHACSHHCSHCCDSARSRLSCRLLQMSKSRIAFSSKLKRRWSLIATKQCF